MVLAIFDRYLANRVFKPQSRRVFEMELMLKNMSQSYFAAFMLILLVLICLWGSVPTLELLVWGGTCSAMKWWICVRSRQWLLGVQTRSLKKIYSQLMGMSLAYGAIWGALIWVGFYQDTSAVSSIFINTVLNGVAIANLILASPTPGLFAGFALAEYVVVVSRYLYLGGNTNYILSIAAFLCFFALLSLERNIFSSIKESINLRSKNNELLNQLTLESEKAKLAFQKSMEAHLGKSRFLAAASHDLRQPIHALGLYHELLVRKNTSDELNGILKSAITVTQSFSGMLDSLLDYSRIEAGAVQPSIQCFHLQTIIDKLEPEFAPQANAKDLYYRTRESGHWVDSDPALMELILRNLISNAIRYTHQGGVLVACRSQGDFVSLEVWDTGVGIAETEQEGIYEEFRQLDNPERDRAKGLGLGLAIVKGLVGILNLRISLTSRLGRGSVFKVLLPKSQSSPSVMRPNAIRVPTGLGKVRVLAIDDDEFVRDAIRQILFEMGCDCDVVGNLDEALLSAKRQVPDVILSDYMLRENLTGIQVIQHLREVFGQRIPAFVITGDTSPRVFHEAKNEGVELLHKPLLPDELYATLAQAMQAKAD